MSIFNINNKITQESRRSHRLSGIDPNWSMVDEINNINLEHLDNSEIERLSKELGVKAKNGIPLDDLLIEAFALVKEAAKRTLGLYPFNVQLMAGIAMHQGKIIEMQTGEGKTLAAVFTAYLNAASGKGVHVLTFNDYLAIRDAAWMGPVYRLLGLSCGFVREGMSINERKAAYGKDITYITAKEAGFDYLRDSLCLDIKNQVHRGFNYAIIDEADSILIDEARVPLVLAGEAPLNEDNTGNMAEIVGRLEYEIDYSTDEYARNVYLTDEGLKKVETALNCSNLYLEENLDSLIAVNCALQAKALLQKDVDYIVRDSRIELVDEFTGRVADKRHWPDGLQAAVEAKEGIGLKAKGRIFGSITLHNFLKSYQKLSGMTATAKSSEEEFLEFYGLEIAEIPPNRTCIRVDYPDLVFTHKTAKYNALMGEIKKVHADRRPILIGTGSVDESHSIAALLLNEGIACQVLNAKNDELEARIIADAGALDAVTVSTNMAGRGTDIRLGGKNEEDKQKVAFLGGLYVIGLNRSESRRIDSQLRGRAGRQGDPGSSRFFISLEDDLIKKYGIEKALPIQFMKLRHDAPIEKKVVNDRISHIQRVIQGQNFEIRKTLRKYWYILEQQRKIIESKRLKVLNGDEDLIVFQERAPEKYYQLLPVIGYSKLKRVTRLISLKCIDEGWADYLDYIEYIREGIHLVSISGQNPLDEFHKTAVDVFEGLPLRMEEEAVRRFNSIEAGERGIDEEKEGLKGPTSTWTYIISDDYFINNLGASLSGNSGFSLAAAMTGPLLLGSLFYQRFIKKR